MTTATAILAMFVAVLLVGLGVAVGWLLRGSTGIGFQLKSVPGVESIAKAMHLGHSGAAEDQAPGSEPSDDLVRARAGHRIVDQLQ